VRRQDDKPDKPAPGAGDPKAPLSCLNCQQREHAEWCELEGEDLELLDAARVTNLYQPGQVLFYQGNPCLGIFCVESGELALRKTDESGHSVIVRLVHAGQTLGYRAFFAGDNYTATCEALTEAQVCFIDKEAVRQLIHRNPALGLQFLRTVSEDLREAEEGKLAAVSLPVRARFAHLLLTLKDRHGTMGDDGVLRIELPMSRQDIAALLGARPETVARTIRALEDDGVARFSGREVWVEDLDSLLDEIEAA
jgi:CRP/FNR family transcriptional regulator